MTRDIWIHRLSFGLRFRNHFTRRPVEAEFPVRLDRSFLMPVARPGSLGIGGEDRSHRFTAAGGCLPGAGDGARRPSGRARHPPGRRLLSVHRRAGRGAPGAMAAAVRERGSGVALPLAQPQVMIERDLWPTPSATVPPAITGLRGQLRGNAIQGLDVRVTPVGAASRPFTRSDPLGDFLFCFPIPG